MRNKTNKQTNKQTTRKQTHNDRNAKLIINLQRKDVESNLRVIRFIFFTARPTPAPKPHVVKGISKTKILFVILGSRKTKRFHFNRQ